MENMVQVFSFEENEVRTLLIEDEVWFVGKDVATILGYGKTQNAISAHVDDEDKTTALIQGTGSNYKSKTVLINESGVYSLVMSSKLPTAKKFKRWVTSEVLPSIRKTEEQGMSNLTIFNSDLIPVYTTDTGEQVVLGRDLHERLKIGQDYSSWFKRMIGYGFIENIDYFLLTKNSEQKGSGGHNRKDHILTSDMAREIAMVQRTPEGKAIRKKLLELAKLASEGKLPSWRIHDELERAKAWIEEEEARRALEFKNSELEAKVEEDRPKVECYETFLDTGGLTNFRKSAHLLGIPEQTFMDALKAEKYVYYDATETLLPYAQWKKKGYFEVKKVGRHNGKVREQTFLTPEGLSYFALKFKSLRIPRKEAFFENNAIKISLS